jgi:hypothetical protein
MPSTIDLTNLTVSFQYYSTISVGSIGFMANLMNIHVCMSSEIQKTSMGFSNICLSITQIFTIIIICFLNFYPQPFGVPNLLITSTLACKLIPFFSRIFPQVGAWINVFMSFDRLIVMHYENMDAYKKRPNLIKTKMNLSFIFFMLTIIVSIINFPSLLYEVTGVGNNVTNVTVFMCAPPSVNIGLLRDFIPLFVRIVIPSVLQIVMSVILVNKLLKLKINVNTLSLKREYKYTFTIIVLNIVYIFTDLMAIASLISINVYGYNQTYISKTSNESAIASFIYIFVIIFVIFIICDLLFFVNLFTNKKFQREAKRLLFDWWARRFFKL